MGESFLVTILGCELRERRERWRCQRNSRLCSQTSIRIRSTSYGPALERLNVKHRFVILIMLLVLAQPSFAQNRGRGVARAPSLPPPRFADGRVNFGPTPGQLGIWLPGDGLGIRNQLAIESNDPRVANAFPGLKPKLSEVPFQPWARELYEYRRNGFEPHTRCKPSGGARQFLTPYGVEFVDMPDLKRMFIMDVGGPHSFRTIFTDGTV